MPSYSDIQKELVNPFDITDLDFRAGSYGVALVYVDVRAYQKRLDEVCPGDWQEGAPTLLAQSTAGEAPLVSVVVPLTIAGRTEYGVSDFKSPTGARAQAFKRACANHSLGSYLYDTPDLSNSYQGGKLVVDKSSLIAQLYEHWGLELPAGFKVAAAPTRQPARREPAPTRSGGFTKGQRGKLHYAGLEDDEIDRLDLLGKTKPIMDLAFSGAEADEIREAFLTGGRSRW